MTVDELAQDLVDKNYEYIETRLVRALGLGVRDPVACIVDLKASLGLAVSAVGGSLDHIQRLSEMMAEAQEDDRVPWNLIVADVETFVGKFGEACAQTLTLLRNETVRNMFEFLRTPLPPGRAKCVAIVHDPDDQSGMSVAVAWCWVAVEQ